MKSFNIKHQIAFTCVAVFTLFTLTGCTTTGSTVPPLMERLEQKADDGDANAQYRLGLRYTNGSGVSQIYRTATIWFNKAAKANHAAAQYMAGINYYTGRGVAQNHTIAVELFTKAADQGHSKSQYQLADSYANARGVLKDLPWAARYFEKSARQGHAPAMLSFGVIRGIGSGVSKNLSDAWVWISLAEREKGSEAAILRAHIEKKLSPSELQAARKQVSKWVIQKDGGLADVPTVRYVQHQLNRAGINVGLEDGILGSRTRLGITQYIKSKSLEQSADAITQDLIKSLRTKAVK